MLEMSGAQWASVYLGEHDDEELRQSFHTGAAPVNPAAVRQLAREAVVARRPLSRPSNRDGEALLAIPLLGSSRCLGAMCVGCGDALPDAGDVESLILFASQAASAAESLLLLGEVRLGRDQLASIMASTREGMLLVGDDGRVAVANSAFFTLAEATDWLGRPTAPADLADLPLHNLLWQWQTTAGFAPHELEQLTAEIAAVAEGRESFRLGQLNGGTPGARSLEWSILRATREGAPATGDEAPRRWPILLTVRDITAAKEAERLRNDLTNMMVHDLRSPLSSIISSIDLIFRGITGEVTRQQRDVLTIAYGSTQRLLNMINLLLDISRLEGGHMPLEPAALDAEELVAMAFGNLQVLADTKGVALRPAAADAPPVYADRELVLRVLQNLLDNALKFSPKGSSVTLAAIAAPGDPGFVRFEVRDAGIGIKPQDREQIFVKFGQAGNRRSTGSGLGLTFCKLVAEAHGGRIWVESEPGKGSSFFFTLPVAPPAAG
jgi:signal transduction histidine kinase